jgi:hypothetical protein
MGDKPAYTAAYTGDGIEAYEPMGVGGGVQSPPILSDATLRNLRDAVHQASKAPWFASPIPYIRRTEAAARAALEAEVKRLRALLADAENRIAALPEKRTAFGPIVCARCHMLPQLADSSWCYNCTIGNALRGGDGRPR